MMLFFFFSSRRRHTRSKRDWSSDVCSSDLSSIAYYKPEGGTPLSISPLRITPTRIVWASEDHLLYAVPRIAIGSMDRTTGNTQNFDLGEIDPVGGISRCPDGHILFTGFPKGAGQARV